MAYEISRRRPDDISSGRDTALGLSLPLQRGNRGYFEQNFSTIEQAKTNIRNLLKTRRGERLIQTNFGTGLSTILFEQLDEPNIAGVIEDEIETAFERWLPYVNLENVEIDASPSNADRNRVEISIDFRVGNDIDVNTVTFTIEE